jgi:hypothetical protein
MSHCPICKLDLEVRGDICEDGTWSCPNGHYSHSHSYGQYEEMYDVEGQGLNILNMAWSYKDSHHVARQAAIEAFLEYARNMEMKT